MSKIWFEGKVTFWNLKFKDCKSEMIFVFSPLHSFLQLL